SMRAEPKTVTPGPTCDSVSNESTNSAMMRKILHGSSLINAILVSLLMALRLKRLNVLKKLNQSNERIHDAVNPKTEIRKPKFAIVNPLPITKARRLLRQIIPEDCPRASDFGFLSDFGLRRFGFGRP